MSYVRYISEPSDQQAAFSGSDNPRGKLELGKIFEVERTKHLTWSEKLFLVGVDCGRGFDSVSFRDVLPGFAWPVGYHR